MGATKKSSALSAVIQDITKFSELYLRTLLLNDDFSIDDHGDAIIRSYFIHGNDVLKSAYRFIPLDSTYIPDHIKDARPCHEISFRRGELWNAGSYYSQEYYDPILSDEVKDGLSKLSDKSQENIKSVISQIEQIKSYTRQEDRNKARTIALELKETLEKVWKDIPETNPWPSLGVEIFKYDRRIKNIERESSISFNAFIEALEPVNEEDFSRRLKYTGISFDDISLIDDLISANNSNITTLEHDKKMATVHDLLNQHAPDIAKKLLEDELDQHPYKDSKKAVNKIYELIDYGTSAYDIAKAINVDPSFFGDLIDRKTGIMAVFTQANLDRDAIISSFNINIHATLKTAREISSGRTLLDYKKSYEFYPLLTAGRLQLLSYKEALTPYITIDKFTDKMKTTALFEHFRIIELQKQITLGFNDKAKRSMKAGNMLNEAPVYKNQFDIEVQVELDKKLQTYHAELRATTKALPEYKLLKSTELYNPNDKEIAPYCAVPENAVTILPVARPA